MKKLSLVLIASAIALSLSAQTKPKGTAPKGDTALAPSFPQGQYILQVDVETGIDILKAMQQTDYSKNKTDKAMAILLQQMRFEESQWAKSTPKADSTTHK